MNFVALAITIFVCITAIVALIILGEVLEKNWIYSLITVVIVPTIIQILFTIKSPKFSDDEQKKEEVVEMIEQSEKKLKGE